MKPLLRWPGSKRRISELLVRKMSPHLSDRGRFIELFAGSAATFFEMQPHRAVLVDACKPLISFYEAIKREPEVVADEIAALCELPFGKETFMRIRGEWNGRDFGPKFAARLLYLNKLGYNGLFRLNSKLEFNVPWGKKAKLPEFPGKNELRHVSHVLSRAKLHAKDFSLILRAAHAGDVVYADPPYWGTFNGYAGLGFSERDQIRLARGLRRAAERGVSVFASNVDCPAVRRLYESWSDIEIIPVRHTIGAKSESRSVVNEVLVVATAPSVDRNQMKLFESFEMAGSA